MDALVTSGGVADRISAAAALAVALVRARCEIWLVSPGISEDEASRMGMRQLPSVQAALDEAMARYPRGQVSVLQHATEILPLPASGRDA
jgi:alpha-D-ribose 1-methylphosphonate 5-triphosphate synthase subunit PhnH